MAANGSTCQVSLSELCRLPVSNLRLSAHISAPWTQKRKKKKTKTQQQRASGPKSLAVDIPREARARAVFPSTQSSNVPGALLLFCGLLSLLSCENHTVVCAATLKQKKTRSCLGLCKISLTCPRLLLLLFFFA